VLQNFGYVFKGELNIPLRYYFSKNTTQSKVNLHVVESGHGFIALNLCFRDYLRINADASLAYAQCKEQLLQDPQAYQKTGAGFTNYSLGKDQFIKGILEQAGFTGYHVNFCLHDNEWEAYHRIREKQIFNLIQVKYDRQHPVLTAANYYHLVLYKGIKIVSIAQVELISETAAVLRNLATDAPYQRQGHGVFLLKFLEQWLQHKGCKIFQMHAHLGAEIFYRKAGYTPIQFADHSAIVVKQPVAFKDYVDLGKYLK
jgi:GNAT superfamily N-acetyltransferase